jgi:hypothetical protein
VLGHDIRTVGGAKLTKQETERQLVSEIGQYVAPSASGRLYSETAQADQAFVEDVNGLPLVDNQMKDIKKLLDQWQIDPDRREDLLEVINGQPLDETDANYEQIRIRNLRLIRDRLEARFRETGRLYSPAWIQAYVQRMSALEAHPIFVFSQLVANKTHYAATAYIKNAGQLNYVPYIKNVIEGRAELIKRLEKHRDVAREVHTAAKRNEEAFNEVRDKLLEESFPTSGIDLGVAMRVVGTYLDTLKGTKAETLDDIEKLHMMYTPANPTMALVTGSEFPPWESHYTIRPINTFASISGGSLAILSAPATATPEFTKQTNKDDYMDFLTYHDRLVTAAKLNITVDLDALLERAIDIVINGTISKIKIDDKYTKTSLAIDGKFNEYMREEFAKDNLEKFATRYYLKPKFKLGGDQVDAVTFVKSTRTIIFANDLVDIPQDFYIPLGPYTPATLWKEKGERKLYEFDPTALEKTKSARESVRDFYTRLDGAILNPKIGRWKELEIQIYRNTQKMSTTTMDLERAASAVEKLYLKRVGVEKNLAVFKKLINSIRTGSQFETLLGIIREFEPDKPLGTIFAENRKLGELLERLSEALDSTGGPALPIAQPIKFPLQYHIDVRFTILYVVLRYEYVRNILAIATEECGRLYRERTERASAEYAEAMQSSIDVSVDDKKDVTNLGIVRWSLLPENSGIISFDPLVSGHIDSAWAWILEHATAIPWESEKFENISASDIIDDMSNSPMALRVKNYLADVVALQFAQANANNTTQRANTSSAPQLRATTKFESTLIIQALNLRHRFDSSDPDKVIFYFDSRTRR